MNAKVKNTSTVYRDAAGNLIKDRLGRVVGGRYSIYHDPSNEMGIGGVGEYLTFCQHTRDGKGYQKTHTFRSKDLETAETGGDWFFARSAAKYRKAAAKGKL